MQSPSQEIHAVIELVNSAVSPDIQKAAINRYFTSDAGFRNPWYAVKPGPLSRESILGIYQWYRTVSPRIDTDIRNVVYDRLHDTVYVELVQLYHIRFSPFKPAPCRIFSRLVLRHENGFHYIAMQEDFLHPDDIATSYLSYLGPLVRMWLSGSALISNLCTKGAQVLGIWRAAPGVDHVNIEHVPTKPYKSRPGEGRLKHKVRREVSRSAKQAEQGQGSDDIGAFSRAEAVFFEGEGYHSGFDSETGSVGSGATRFGGAPLTARRFSAPESAAKNKEQTGNISVRERSEYSDSAMGSMPEAKKRD
ncbi:hypothetical protein BDZ97DRAFT_1929478 [Flammula alnicola]|nr:hypothetical protein BDZ97DRAFT_1929478 [Flammula alnicola]